MRCNTCGAPMPPGAKVCPNCGTAVPITNGTTADASAQEPPIPPTIYGSPINPVSNYDSNIQNPYDRPLQPPLPSPANQYQPSPPNQYQPSPYNQNQGVPNQYPNQYAMGNVPPGYPPPGYMPPQPLPRRKTRWGLIIGIIAGVLVLACVGVSALGVGLYNIGTAVNAHATATAAANTANDTTTSAATPATTDTTPAANTNTSNASPSGVAIDADAASIVTDAQPAKGVDENTAAPKNATDMFKAGDRVYVVFKLNSAKFNPATQKLYVGAKFYVDDVLGTKITPITFDQPSPGGYFAATYKVPAKGTAELYLCYKVDCSDEKLAQVVNFTVAS